MKKILNYVIFYFKEEIKPLYLITTVSFAAICILIQYNFKTANFYVEHHRQETSYFFRAFSLYALPFIGTLLLYSAFYKKWNIWFNYSFVTLVVFTLIIYTTRCTITFHNEIIKDYVDQVHQHYWLKIGNQLVHGLILFVLPCIWWWTKEKEHTNLYGWRFKDVSLKPYFIFLLFLVPLVAIASTQKDFLKVYPQVANMLKTEPDHPFVSGALFELSYGFDFLMNEFFFRGFIVLAFVKFIGRGIILPMALFYVFIHFGKPLGETISSLFGGLLLGIVAYETRSIYGGVILHIGIAWLMEIGAGLGRFLYLSN